MNQLILTSLFVGLIFGSLQLDPVAPPYGYQMPARPDEIGRGSKAGKITVYLFLHEDCLISQYYTVTLNELVEEFSSEQITFQGIFPNESSTELGMLMFAEKYGVDFPLQQDHGSDLANTFGATITPEVVVYDEDHKVILYQGRIDNSYQRIGRRRRVVTQHELQEVLESIRANEPVATRPAAAVGCFIERRKG
ncbi:hypothetical protein CEQ90_12675 [Lewinellaceae bacterium SD302]|nr:hypothetical protein CEQ90_12675 [Lewinellaceae bacterium SD302]